MGFTVCRTEVYGVEVVCRVYDNLDEAVIALAKQTHNEDVAISIAAEIDWDNKNYRAALMHEARNYLEEHNGVGSVPQIDGTPFIQFKQK